MKLKKSIFCCVVIGLIAAVVSSSMRETHNVLSSLLLANIEALGNPEVDGYTCTVEIKCCGILSGKRVSCTGVNKCESLKDWFGYPCKGVKCDGKETLC